MANRTLIPSGTRFPCKGLWCLLLRVATTSDGKGRRKRKTLLIFVPSPIAFFHLPMSIENIFGGVNALDDASIKLNVISFMNVRSEKWFFYALCKVYFYNSTHPYKTKFFFASWCWKLLIRFVVSSRGREKVIISLFNQHFMRCSVVM